MPATHSKRKHGINGPDFAEWAQQHRPAEFRQAQSQHVYGRSPTAYDALAAAYLRAVPPTTAALQQAGIQVNAATRGRPETIVVNGVELERHVAAKLGLI
jgi:hypothetical protein